MEDKSLHNSQYPQGISETLQNYIDSMVEEIVLEGKPFDTQKKYLRKFSENEGLDYEAIEKGIDELVETMREMKTSDSKMLIKLALIQAKDAFVTEEAVLSIAHQVGKNINEDSSAKRNTITEIIQSLQLQSTKNEKKISNIEGGKVTKLLENERVDLGLPSGTLWATVNVGATKPEAIDIKILEPRETDDFDKPEKNVNGGDNTNKIVKLGRIPQIKKQWIQLPSYVRFIIFFLTCIVIGGIIGFICSIIHYHMYGDLYGLHTIDDEIISSGFLWGFLIGIISVFFYAMGRIRKTKK